MISTRDLVLARIRTAVQHAPEPPEVVRDYRPSHTPADPDPDTLPDLLAENLADYHAQVHRCTQAQLPALIGALLAERRSRTLVVPAGVPGSWLTDTRAHLLRDDPPLTAQQLDATDSVLTSCALAVAETGTIVLDGGPGQGRRILTLVPDHHLCVVRTDQVVAALPQALPLLDPSRAQTWISGPSATSDIELDRVEGVHGPRTLDVVLVS